MDSTVQIPFYEILNLAVVFIIASSFFYLTEFGMPSMHNGSFWSFAWGKSDQKYVYNPMFVCIFILCFNILHVRF